MDAIMENGLEQELGKALGLEREFPQAGPDGAGQLLKDALSGIFDNCHYRVRKENSGLYGFHVDISPRMWSDERMKTGPVRDWRAELLAWQAFEIVARHNDVWPQHKAVFERARRFFEAGDWQGGMDYVIAYRNLASDKSDFWVLVKDVKAETCPALSGTLLAGKTEGGWYHGAASVKLECRISRGTRPAMEPLLGTHICAGMPSLKMAVNDALAHAIGCFAPDAESAFLGSPRLGEVLKMMSKDMEKARVL